MDERVGVGDEDVHRGDGSQGEFPGRVRGRVARADRSLAAMAVRMCGAYPTVYAYNAWHNGVRFLVDLLTSFFSISMRGRVTRAGARRRRTSVALMTLIAVVAVVIGCCGRDRRWSLVLALFAMMAAAHALTDLDADSQYVSRRRSPSVLSSPRRCLLARRREVAWARSASRRWRGCRCGRTFRWSARATTPVSCGDDQDRSGKSRTLGTCSSTFRRRRRRPSAIPAAWIRPVERDSPCSEIRPVLAGVAAVSARWRFHCSIRTETNRGKLVLHRHLRIQQVGVRDAMLLLATSSSCRSRWRQARSR